MGAVSLLSLDALTKTQMDAAPTPDMRAQAVLDAFPDPVYVRVYNGADVVMGWGTMQTTWALRATHTLTIGEVSAFTVTNSGTPDASWYLRFESGVRWLRGTFGLTGSGADFTWSLPTWVAGQQGMLGTVTVATQPSTQVSRTFDAIFSSAGVAITFGWNDLGTVTLAGSQEGTQQTYDLKPYATLPSGSVPAFTIQSGPSGVRVDQTTGILTKESNVAANVGYALSIDLVVATPPLPEVVVNLRSTAVTASTAELAWDAAAFADTYKVERSFDGATWQQVRETAALVFPDSGLASNTLYYYRVRGHNTVGDGPYSNVLQVLTQQVIVVPDALADWLLRSGQDPANPQPGVMWFNAFDTAAEVDRFRYNSAAGGNTLATNVDGCCLYMPSGGPNGVGGAVRLLRKAPAGNPTAFSVWQRPLCPLPGDSWCPTDEPGVAKLAALGIDTTIPAWEPTYGRSKMASWKHGFYSPVSSRVAGYFYHGNEFWLSYKIFIDPARATATPDGQKYLYVTDATGSTNFINFIYDTNHVGGWISYNGYRSGWPDGSSGTITDPQWDPTPANRYAQNVAPYDGCHYDYYYGTGDRTKCWYLPIGTGWATIMLHFITGDMAGSYDSVTGNFVNWKQPSNGTYEIFVWQPGMTPGVWTQIFGKYDMQALWNDIYAPAHGLGSIIATTYTQTTLANDYYTEFSHWICSQQAIPAPRY